MNMKTANTTDNKNNNSSYDDKDCEQTMSRQKNEPIRINCIQHNEI